MTPEGMLTLDELAARWRAGDIDTVIVAFTDAYGRLMGKRFDAGFFLEETARLGTHGCDYLLTTDMAMEPVPGYRFANWERGYGDVHLVPDLATLRVASWLTGTALVLCDVEHEETHEPVAQAPRTILKHQLARAAELGFEVKAASELEYYLFSTPYREAAAGGYAALQPTGWYLEDYHILQGSRTEAFTAAARRHLRRSGVPVENSKGEWGLGQHEINIRYADVLTMADRHVIFKQCLKELADAQGLSLTFMAKPFTDRAGSSCHLHLSLWQGEGNAFFDPELEPGAGETGTDAAAPVAATPAFRHFLAGWLAHLPELMVCYAPTVNAYKRYQDASWAPTRLAWSHDNRTAGFRVVGRGPSLRIECRVPGADCNPYLAFAAALASGLDGMARKLEPPPAYRGDVYAATDLPHVPRSLGEAAELFAASDFAREAFGAEVHEHYLHFFRTEQAAFDQAVTDWERRRYFEQI